MLRTSIAIVTLVMLSLPASAQSHVETGEFLLPHCKAELNGENDKFGTLCVGILTGQQSVSSFLPPDMRFCPPTLSREKKLEAVIRDIEKLLADHPEERNDRFTMLALSAQHALWPCKMTEESDRQSHFAPKKYRRRSTQERRRTQEQKCVRDLSF